jgi:hypothetical protein
MGRLSGFRYHEITKKLRSFGFAFDRQAAGSHEIWYWRGKHWYCAASCRTPPSPIMQGICPRARSGPSLNRRALMLMIFLQADLSLL